MLNPRRVNGNSPENNRAYFVNGIAPERIENHWIAFIKWTDMLRKTDRMPLLNSMWTALLRNSVQ